MITSSQMRVLEINSEAFGVSTLQLMENAGRSVADEIEREMGTSSLSVIVFVGHGGKGGDGVVTARHLADRGANVTVITMGEIKHRDALVNYGALEEMDFSVRVLRIDDLDSPLKADVLVDAMLGTGVRGRVRYPFNHAISLFNASKGFKVAIDVPSGIDPDTGEALGEFVSPDLVVTFHDVKPGLLKYNFKYVVKKIGIPPEASIYMGPGDLLTLKQRDMRSRKGVGGRVLIVGGSSTFSGAPALSALASLRTGADLVYVASPERTAEAISSYSPDLIAIKLSGRNFNEGNIKELGPWVEKANAVVFGPGLGLEEETVKATPTFVEMVMRLGKPLVLDADGLKIMKGSKLSKNVVVTPHPGEFKIFFGEEQKENERERINQVIEKARNCNCVVLLKGYLDIISDGYSFRLNKAGNPGMTAGGTGDTLTGIIATFMAQGYSPYISAGLGALVNSLSGTLAYRELGTHLTASDVVSRIPKVLNDPITAFKERPYRRVISS
ncbi:MULTISPECIES: NAD(P)H-hydrate dehydratase [Metallosphaera]|uniref:NAD(P)H-hydrate dehydratase n=1 Tax=Metallosphaera TaxID=41980 RepID=UPI001F05F70A|nr:NAD(P)H-hydrate dehydratase [Metallosphaera sedula]MCH1771759.1 NAD(P)H-hydrate dehydratase [Metallosphaera sedula]MCP6728357.1 NAD(P)H-hydrate dehydratase [Metallosphaera sedula]